MKSTIKNAATAAAVWLLACGPALAQPCNIGDPGCPAPIPEPSSLPLFIAGAVAVAVVARYFKKK